MGVCDPRCGANPDPPGRPLVARMTEGRPPRKRSLGRLICWLRVAWILTVWPAGRFEPFEPATR